MLSPAAADKPSISLANVANANRTPTIMLQSDQNFNDRDDLSEAQSSRAQGFGMLSPTTAERLTRKKTMVTDYGPGENRGG